MELPYEVLIHIFHYLRDSDRKAASETCHSWYMAANSHCFLKNKVVTLYKTVLTEDNYSPLEIFENSEICYYNYLFHDVEISSKVNRFWDKLGDCIKFLTLSNCDICEKVFAYILQKCINLETLSVKSCKELFMSGRLLEGKTENLLNEKLLYLKSLDLSGNQYLTDALFNRFVSATPSLQELNLSACSVQFHQGLVKKFYSANSDVTPSESVLTFYFIKQFIIAKASNIKRLCFSKTLIDGSALKCLSEIKDLCLESLKVSFCDQLTNTGISALAVNQTSLKELDIGLCTRVTDQSLVYICSNLVNLEYLNIQRCRAVSNLGIIELNKLKKLKTLNISQCELITKDGIEQGICSKKNLKLEELDVNSLNLDEAVIIMMSERLPNLRYLNISYCFNAITDTSIQTLFKNQVYLQVLKFSHCNIVSDAGLTGMGKVYFEDVENPSRSSYEEHESHMKIYLGSKAEEEIVRDAQRKYDVMRMCEKVAMDTYSGYSLAHLKQLKELDISGCNKITDVSLTYAFNFLELISLNLSRCQQISHEGILHLVKNCPSIEYINLTDCYNLKDEALKEIVKGLKRLKHLELRGCNLLTDKTIYYIQEYCTKLKFLDLQGCRSISPELTCSLGGNLNTLHTILFSKPGPYMNSDGLKDRRPGTKFLPALMKKLHLH